MEIVLHQCMVNISKTTHSGHFEQVPLFALSSSTFVSSSFSVPIFDQLFVSIFQSTSFVVFSHNDPQYMLVSLVYKFLYFRYIFDDILSPIPSHNGNKSMDGLLYQLICCSMQLRYRLYKSVSDL